MNRSSKLAEFCQNYHLGETTLVLESLTLRVLRIYSPSGTSYNLFTNCLDRGRSIRIAKVARNDEESNKFCALFPRS